MYSQGFGIFSGLAQGLLCLLYEAVTTGDMYGESNRTFSVFYLRWELILSDSEKMVDAADAGLTFLSVCLVSL